MVRYEPVMDSDGFDYADAETESRVYRRARRSQVEDHYDGHEDAYYGEEPVGLVDRVLARPGKLAMAAVALIGFGVVGINAAYLQPGAHPAPMLSTRVEAPASAIPSSQVSQRAITLAPTPMVPPSGRDGATASIGMPDDQIAAIIARPPYAAPAPTPRPAFGTRDVAQAPAPTRGAPVVARQVQTIAINDPIGALLAPVVAPQATIPGQPTQPAAATRSAQPLVAAVQSILAEMGYNPGSVDGVIGPSTEEAIRRFQLRRALEPNGQITTDLLREIERVTGTRITTS